MVLQGITQTLYLHYQSNYAEGKKNGRVTQNKMNTATIEIGSKVTYLGEKNFFRTGVVYGLDIENNRAFVKFEQHGNCSINLKYLILA